MPSIEDKNVDAGEIPGPGQTTTVGILRRKGRAVRKARVCLWRGQRWWRRKPVHWRHEFRSNIILGLAIEVFLMACHGLPVVVGLENLAADFANRVHAGMLNIRLAQEQNQLRSGLIDIDEETWRDPSWGGGEPYYAPRRRIAELLHFATSLHPRIVVLDIFVEEPETPDDKILVEELKRLPDSIDYIFVRSVQRPLVHEQPGSFGNVLARIQPSPLDKLLYSRPNNHPNFHVAAPYFEASSDGLVRGWRLWSTGCRPSEPASDNGAIAVVPSVQLLVSALLQSGASRQNRAAIERAFDAYGSCAVGPTASLASLQGPGRQDAGAIEGLPKRIAQEHWVKNFDPGQSEGGTETRILYSNGLGDGIPHFPTVSVQSLLSSQTGVGAQSRELKAFSQQVRNGVLVIGQSFDAAGDTHSTPLGPMPGSQIILNAISSIMEPGVIHEIPAIAEWPFVLVCVCAIASINASIERKIASLVLSGLVIIIVIPVSIALLKNGIWLNFATPLIGIALHNAFDDVIDITRTVRQRHNLSNS